MSFNNNNKKMIKKTEMIKEKLSNLQSTLDNLFRTLAIRTKFPDSQIFYNTYTVRKSQKKIHCTSEIYYCTHNILFDNTAVHNIKKETKAKSTRTLLSALFNSNPLIKLIMVHCLSIS